MSVEVVQACVGAARRQDAPAIVASRWKSLQDHHRAFPGPRAAAQVAQSPHHRARLCNVYPLPQCPKWLLRGDSVLLRTGEGKAAPLRRHTSVVVLRNRCKSSRAMLFARFAVALRLWNRLKSPPPQNRPPAGSLPGVQDPLAGDSIP